mmetsp:Transcript_72135/g.192799  ORF Transcript_72135/g.192799 Transcript_72135/m.192799 type:complete len:218 (+) Transcript_72135:1357-2010(+)
MPKGKYTHRTQSMRSMMTTAQELFFRYRKMKNITSVCSTISLYGCQVRCEICLGLACSQVHLGVQTQFSFLSPNNLQAHKNGRIRNHLRAFVDEKDGAGEEVKLRLPLHHLLNVPQAFKKPWHQPSTNSSAIVKETLQSFTESLRVQFFASMFVHQLKFSVVDLVYTHTTDSGPQTSSGCNVVLIPAPTQFVRKPIRRSGGETHLYVQNAGLVIAIC